MKFALLTFFALALMTLASACSGGGSGGGGGKANDKAGGGGVQPQALVAQPWCHNDNDKQQQERMVLTNDGKFLYEVYSLGQEGRGESMFRLQGQWLVENGSTLVLTPEGKQPVRLDLKYVDKTQSPDGAAQVIVKDATFNPCN